MVFTGDTLTCTDGPDPEIINNTELPKMRVKDRHFHKTIHLDFPGTAVGTVKVEGTFRQHYTKASGIFRANYEEFAGVHIGCDTGKLDWNAQS